MFTSEEGTCSVGFILPVSFFMMFHVVFVLLSDFAVSVIKSLFCFFNFSEFYNTLCNVLLLLDRCYS